MGSIPAKGSSSRIKLGSTAKALAISVLLRSPPDKTLPIFLRTCANPNSSSNPSNLSFCSFLVSLVISKTAFMLSSTLKCLKTEASCGKYPIPALARLYIAILVMSWSSRYTFPESGLINPTTI